MPDTVAASVIAASLGDSAPSFVNPGTGVPAGPLAATSLLDSIHVGGGAHALEPAGGTGSPLLVEFVTWRAAAAQAAAPSTVPGGYGAGPDHDAPRIAGAIHAGLEQLP